MAGSFTHEPLLAAQPSIRLVELQPKATSSDEIQCNIRVVKFDDTCPAYEALSYCWGDQRQKSPIVCNGRSLEITSSLYETLVHLRYEEGPRVLWIDQLAIDQQNTAEKSQQVSMMREIYVRSTCTLVWLGVGSEYAPKALDTLERIAMDAFPRVDPVTGTLEDDAKPKDIYSIWRQTRLGNSERAWVADLLKRAWFRRVWIIQEACVPANVRMLLGERTVNFDLVHFAFGIALSTTPLTVMMDGLNHLHALSRYRGAFQSGGRLSLTDLLFLSRGFSATQPVDKLFALYGLTSTDLESNNIRPDYTLDTRSVFTNSIVSLIRQDGNLRLLELCGGQLSQYETAGVPSWVPMLHEGSNHVPLLTDAKYELHGIYGESLIHAAIVQMYQSRGASLRDTDEERIREQIQRISETVNSNLTARKAIHIPEYEATRSSHPGAVLLDPDGTLTLSGQLIDSIHQAGSTLPALRAESASLAALADSSAGSVLGKMWDIVSAETMQTVPSYRVMFEREAMVLDNPPQRAAPYPTGEAIESVFRKTVFANHTSGTEEETASAFREWRRASKPLRKTLERRSASGKPDPSPSRVLGAATLGSFLSSTARIQCVQLMQVSYERRLAWTKKGYLALVPGEARETDCISLLKGGRVPFVLRPQLGAWRMIGPCYVHGVMDGEAFEEEMCVEMRLL